MTAAVHIAGLAIAVAAATLLVGAYRALWRHDRWAARRAVEWEALRAAIERGGIR